MSKSDNDEKEDQQGVLGAVTNKGRNSGLRRGFRGIAQRLAISCGRLVNRFGYAIASTVGLVASPAGGACILGTSSAIASTMIGAKSAAKVALASVGVVASLQFMYGFVSSPARELSGIEVLAQLSGGDDTMWKAGKKLMQTFDKLLKAFPQLNRPRLAALRDAAPEELLLRVMTLIGRHQTEHQPEEAEGAKQSTMSGTSPKDEDGGKDDSGQGTVAREEVIKELRYRIHFAEAAYYDMGTEDTITAWLREEGCELLYCSKQSAPHAPVYFVAVHHDRKELIVSLRGTVSVDDAVSDMVVTPECWGDDDDHCVHSGIGKTANTVYSRLQHLAPPFASDGYSIVLIGHSLGAGAAALLAWRLREKDGLENVRAISFACPPCASPSIAEECRDYVVSCVFRDDIVPRLAPKAIVSLEKEMLELSWDEMEGCAGDWGPIGKIVLGRAKEAAEHNKDELDELEKKHKEDPLGHGKANDDDDDDGGNDEEEGEGGGEGNGQEKPEGGEKAMMDPTVPGQIVLLHAKSDAAKTMMAAEVRSGENKSECVPEDQREMDFEAVEIGAQEATLCAFRLCEQAVNDHLLDQYRMGLRMRPRVPGEQQEDPAGARLE